MKKSVSLCRMCVYAGILLLIGVSGCSEDEKGSEMFSIRQFYADSIFLGIEGNLNEPEIIWGNVDTYLAALARMNRYLYVEDNRLKWDVMNGAELNISENIYEYVTCSWKATNNRLEEDGGILETYQDYYRIVNEDVGQGSRSGWDLGKQILAQGRHVRNAEVLLLVAYHVYALHEFGPLSKFIDMEASDFRGDGLGGVQIYGAVSTSDGNYYGYYCANACYFFSGDQKYNCPENDIVTWNRLPGEDLWYFKCMNHNHLPLVTLRNAEYINKHIGLILKGQS